MEKNSSLFFVYIYTQYIYIKTDKQTDTHTPTHRTYLPIASSLHMTEGVAKQAKTSSVQVKWVR